MTYPNQTSFRQEIQKRDKYCLITKHHVSECDAAHLVPRELCEQESLFFIYNKCNGILLSKSLHSLFDKFLWSFDFYDVTFIDKQYCFKILLAPSHVRKNSSISPFNGLYIAVPPECCAFIYFHYRNFVKIHYCYEQDRIRNYKQLTQNDPIFKYLYTHTYHTFIDHLINQTFRILGSNLLSNNNQIDSSRKSKLRNCITSSNFDIIAILKCRIKNNRKEYQVYWDYFPLDLASWEPESNITSYWITWIQIQTESKLDQDWLP